MSLPSVLLGTGASEGIPAVCCDCPVCRHAREVKEKNVRTRSDFLIDETAMIDYSPDLFYQALQNGLFLREIRHIFLTHFHEDHISVPEMGCRLSGIPRLTFDVTVYGSAAALEQVELLFERYADHTLVGAKNYFSQYKLKPLEPFVSYEIDGMKATPVLSSHRGYGVNEIGYNYVITDRRGRTFLYAVDTGWYDESTWEYLRENRPVFDYVIMECTYGDHELPRHQSGHLDYKNMLEMVETLGALGCISVDTPIYLTHICHLHSKTHEETEAMLLGCGWNIHTGYDGLVIV